MTSSAVRTAFQEYLDAFRQFTEVCDAFSKKGWSDRSAVLYYAWHCQRLHARRQELRFEHLYLRGEFDSGVWHSLSRITDRLDKSWGDIEERELLGQQADYRILASEFTEAEAIRASLDKDLLDGPLRTLERRPEYRAARQEIYETVRDLNARLEKLCGLHTENT